MFRWVCAAAAAICLTFALALSAAAQAPPAAKQADPAADIGHPVLESSVHKPLPEQFIWLVMPKGTPDKTDEATPRFFRTTFTVQNVPPDATLYVSAGDHAEAFLNGERVAAGDRDPKSKTYPLVVIASVAKQMRRGVNVLAIQARGGSPLAAKIVPVPEGVMAKAFVITGPGWRASLREESGWEKPDFNDSAWPEAKALGSIDTKVEGYRPWVMKTSNLEWNSDSEMYRWPGYDGISPFLAHLPVTAKKVIDVNPETGGFRNIRALTNADANAEFEVKVPETFPPIPGNGLMHLPMLILDFGREVNGRLEVTSDSPATAEIRLRYGESREEAIRSPYLGTDEVMIPPHSTTYGPKSAFRYALLTFLPNRTTTLRFKSIRADAIYYPVQYRGSFESSDSVLNRIWAVGAYTAHLCMQDAIWDAPKRDRMPWMGDLDVSGKVIDYVFADRFLMQKTMDWLIREAGDPVNHEVNTIPGYSAFWVMGEADYYRHFGDKKYLASLHDPLIQLLDYMTGELNADNVFVNARRGWPFVDWSPELEKDTPEARRATDFEFYRAFSEGAWLLGEMGDSAASAKYQARARSTRGTANHSVLDAKTGTFGSRWQPNAMAIYSGIANEKQASAIWDSVLSQPSKLMISPYYNYYVISAMADAGHRRETLDWIRKYWGGMIEEGATSFWEGYDPSWPKQDFHANLQADDDKGYFVSLAHGWSSGPTAWLAEQILGVQPNAAGFRETTIRPDLAGLEWARGEVPTPTGAISVEYKSSKVLDAHIKIPAEVSATAIFPVCAEQNWVSVNGARTTGQLAEGGKRVEIRLDRAGSYDIHSECVQ